MRSHDIHHESVVVGLAGRSRLDRVETGASGELIYGATVKILDLVSEVHVFRFLPRVGTFRSITHRRHYDAIRRALRRHDAVSPQCRCLSLFASGLLRNDWQDDFGHRVWRMIDGLNRDARSRLGRNIAAGLRVAVVPGKVAARNLEPNPMPAHEDHAGRPKLYLNSFDSARLVVRTADYSVRNVVGDPVGADVDQFRGEVSTRSVGRYIQNGFYRSGYFDVVL